MFTLKSKVALVTGAGRGIGRSIAQQLGVGRGGGYDQRPGSGAAGGNSCHCFLATVRQFAGDVTDPEFPQALVDRTVATLSGLDIIVNNAGYTWDNVIQKTSDEQFQAMLDIHATAPFRILRAASGFIRDSAKREAVEGRRVARKVVNITSLAATDGGQGRRVILRVKRL